MREIRVCDGDEEHAVVVEARPMWAHWVDAHRFREMRGTAESRRLEAIDWMRGLVRDEYIPRRLTECTPVIALALLADTLDDVALAATSAALAQPGAILHIQLSAEGAHIRVGVGEETGTGWP
jgi:hypothetical protein